MFICLSSLMTSIQSSKFNKILKDNKDTCEYSINQRHHCKPIFFFFSFSQIFFIFLLWKQIVSKLLNKKQHKVYHAIKQTINTPLNLKLTLSSMFKQMYVRIKDKSWNERIREKERKHVIWWWTPQVISCKMVRYPKQKQNKSKTKTK